jgi:uncharacterized membrane protein
MSGDLTEWIALALRWFHVIAGIAWIGASFYFIWLDNHLRALKIPKEGVAGELWAVHGGGFYNSQKYLVAPEHMPDELHWFKWEAYSTWISGFLLLCLIYYVGADLYLIDRAKLPLTPFQAVLIGLSAISAGWLVYDTLCRSPIGRNNRLFGLTWFLVLTAAAFGLSHIFSGRGAFIHIGAIIGTVMVANVFAIIIPNQRTVVATLIAGGKPDPKLGKEAKQRSVHNNYMTLPVVFVMISNHHPMIYGNPLNWLLLAGFGAIGWAIRHFFTLRHFGKFAHELLAAAALGFVGVMAIASLAQKAVPRMAQPVSFAQIHPIIVTHCAGCHSAKPTHPGFDRPPKDVAFDHPEEIQRYAAEINAFAVKAEIMPLGNETGMTEDQRALLGRWIAGGARIDR